MDDANQIHVPPSFIHLFVPPGRALPRGRATEIAQRFEVCEDMASALVPRAQELQFRLGITEADVIDQMLAGLMPLTAGDAPVLAPAEARWVVCRLAEQLDWVSQLPPDLLALAGDGAG